METVKLEIELTKDELYFLGKSLVHLFHASKLDIQNSKKEEIKNSTKQVFHHTKKIFNKLSPILPPDFYDYLEREKENGR
jgi:hypothetical protein